MPLWSPGLAPTMRIRWEEPCRAPRLRSEEFVNCGRGERSYEPRLRFHWSIETGLDCVRGRWLVCGSLGSLSCCGAVACRVRSPWKRQPRPRRQGQDRATKPEDSIARRCPNGRKLCRSRHQRARRTTACTRDTNAVRCVSLDGQVPYAESQTRSLYALQVADYAAGHRGHSTSARS